MSQKNVLIGCAWTYANSDIHLGHISAYMAGDVLARFHRAHGDRVCFVSGTDCHGTPTTERAIKEQKTPQEIVERYHQQYCEVFDKMGFSYDMYTLTASPYHYKSAQEMIEQLQANGFLYPKTELASFCPNCKKFVYDREVEVTCPKCGAVSKGDQCGDCDYVFQTQDLLKSKCRICGNQTEIRENTNLYFSLSKFAPELNKHFEDCKGFWRKNTVNETEKFLKEGLLDRAVTRDLNWGIPLPFEGYDDKRIYVWVEAVWGYVSACQKFCEENGLDWRDFWYQQGDNKNLIYMCHGKDNIVFHTIIFPALLLATKEPFYLPDHCVSTEFMNINGEKISKSKGNGWPMLDMLSKFNPDSLRYYCIANGPEKRDSNFTFAEYHAVHNGEIVNKFANFINRTLNYKGLVTKLNKGNLDQTLQEKIKLCYKNTETLILQANFKDALAEVMGLVEDANKYYDTMQPWVLYKSDMNKFNDVMYNCAQIIANLSNLIEPFMPFTAEKLRIHLNIEKPNWELTVVDEVEFGNFVPLFVRLTDKDVM